MNNPITVPRQAYLASRKVTRQEDTDLEPYGRLFLKPLTNRKARFSKPELAEMCRDPQHSPRLIHYLIEVLKAM